MRRTTLVIVGILAVVIVAAGGTAYYVLTGLDGIVQAAIEEFGSRAVGTAVTLDGVEIDAASGRGVLRGLKVANPAGFEAGDALSIAETSIVVDLASLTGDTVVVRDVVVRSPRFHYILGPEGGNLDRIYGNVRGDGADGEAGPAPQGTGAAGPAGEPASGETGPRIVVERLVIDGAAVSVSAAQLGSKGVELTLPTLELKDLGNDGRGLTTAELVGRIAARLQESADAEMAKIPQLRTILATPMTESIKKALENTEKTLESLGDRLKGLVDD